MKLIIHADDFGMAQSINTACLELCKRKTVSSVSIMPNMPYSHETTSLLKLTSVSLGLHATFTEGISLSPAAQVPSLVDREGYFFNFKALKERVKQGRVDSKDVYKELRAQCQLLYNQIGNRLVFVDSHHGVHNRFRPFQDAFLRLKSDFPSITAIRTRSFYLFSNNKKKPALAPPSPLTLSILGLRRFLAHLFYRSYAHRYARTYHVPYGMIVQPTPGAISILQQLTQYDMASYGDHVFYVVVHPAISTDDLPPTNLTQERLDEFAFLRGSKFHDFVSTYPLTHFGSL